MKLYYDTLTDNLAYMHPEGFVCVIRDDGTHCLGADKITKRFVYLGTI